jgi:hypothetical protein
VQAAPKKRAPTEPVRISLLESSGSVAPEFRYALEVYIENTANGYFIYRKETRAEKQILNIKKRITEKKYNQALKSLLKLGVNKYTKEPLPEEKLLGVNYNEFSFKKGKKESHFYYLIKDLEKKDFKNKKDIIQTMKRIKP